MKIKITILLLSLFLILNPVFATEIEQKNNISIENTESLANNYYQEGIKQFNLFTIESLVESIKFYNKSLEIDPNFVQALAAKAESETNLGQFYFIKKQPYKIFFKSARENAEKAVKINPNKFETQRALSLIYIYYGKKQEAIEAAEKAVKLNPNDGTSHFYLWANKGLNLNDPILEKAYKLAPNLPLINFQLGDMYLEKKDFNKAISFLEKAISSSPGLESAYLSIFNAYVLQKEDSAIKKLEEYLNQLAVQYPTNSLPHTYLGILYRKMRKYDESLASFKKSIEIDPTPKAYEEIAYAFYGSYQHYSAVKYFKEQTEKNPDFYLPYYALGAAYMTVGYNAGLPTEHHEDARKCFEKAIALNPEFHHSYYHLGDIYRTYKKYDRASEYFEKALELNEEDAEAYKALGYVYTYRKMYREALEQFSQGLKRMPESPIFKAEIAYVRGKLALQENKKDEAVKYFYEATKTRIDNIHLQESYYHVADIYRERMQMSAAKEWYEHACKAGSEYGCMWLKSLEK